MIKSWGLVILLTSCLIIILFMVTNNPQKILSLESLNGQWIGKHKNYEIIMAIKKDNKCSLDLRIASSDNVEKFNGDCSIDITKKPYSFIIKNITELNTPLYSLVTLKDNNIIHMSEFSTKWRLRPVTLSRENTIIFKKYIANGEKMNNFTFDWENYLTQAQAQISTPEFIISLTLTAITAYILSKIYVRFGQALSNRSNFGNTFVPMAMTTMIIITIVKSSLALSLGLVGALSIVRFRAAIKEPEELIYLFICVAIGLGYGANQITVTIVGFLMVVIAIALIRKSAFKVEKSNVMYLTISKKSKTRLDIEKILEVLEKNSFEVDLKRLDESPTANEVSFITSFQLKTQLLELREALYKLDDQLEVTFLDNTKIF